MTQHRKTDPKLTGYPKQLVRKGQRTEGLVKYNDPSDFWLFPKHRGCCYETIEEMKKAVTKVIDTLTQDDFHGAFQNFLERYKCIAAGGDYFNGAYSFMCVLSIKVPIRKKSGNLFNDPCKLKIFTHFGKLLSSTLWVYSLRYFWNVLVRSYMGCPVLNCQHWTMHFFVKDKKICTAWQHIASFFPFYTGAAMLL